MICNILCDIKIKIEIKHNMTFIIILNKRIQLNYDELDKNFMDIFVIIDYFEYNLYGDNCVRQIY